MSVPESLNIFQLWPPSDLRAPRSWISVWNVHTLQMIINSQIRWRMVVMLRHSSGAATTSSACWWSWCMMLGWRSEVNRTVLLILSWARRSRMLLLQVSVHNIYTAVISRFQLVELSEHHVVGYLFRSLCFRDALQSNSQKDFGALDAVTACRVIFLFLYASRGPLIQIQTWRAHS